MRSHNEILRNFTMEALNNFYEFFNKFRYDQRKAKLSQKAFSVTLNAAATLK